MSRNNKQNLERKLDHLVDLMKILVEQYPHISCAERASMLLALAMDAKQVSQNVGIVREMILNQIIDNYGVEYSEYARSIEGQKNLMIEKMAGAPMVASIDTLDNPTTDPEKILAQENRNFGVGRIRGLARVDYFLHYFIENSSKVFEDIMESLTLIVADLKGIDEEDYYALKEGRLDLQGRYDNLRSQFMEAQGEQIKDAIECNLSVVLSALGCNSQSIARYMRSRKLDYDPITKEEINGESPAEIILLDRKHTTIEMLQQHFTNQLEWKILNEKMKEIQQAEAAGILPAQQTNQMVVIGNNVEQQTNNFFINGRQAN